MAIKKVTLLFNANKGYDRKIIAGISKYVHSEHRHWQLYIEEDFITRLDRLKNWYGDGIIADMDDPKVINFILQKNIPTIGIGSSYRELGHYPNQIPYVATNNDKIAQLAVEHFCQLGF